MFPTLEELGIGFVPWGPVGQGYLTRKIDAESRFDPKLDMRSTFPRFSPETISANTPVIELVKELAEKIGARVVGDGNKEITGVASVAAAGEGDVVFAEDKENLAAALKSRASVVIVGDFA